MVRDGRPLFVLGSSSVSAEIQFLFAEGGVLMFKTAMSKAGRFHTYFRIDLTMFTGHTVLRTVKSGRESTRASRPTCSS